eukprot:CAMPEP_0168354828 /NCGR_PEP_ID=MMETSP0213-20121227/24144_1 /TAXON_ID=151035 /ORGANISM="Euplotes harpa, Strain FSP1.4" /LENGTH=76 /DNA_ID=CAMNT_0008366835 /DNA_START=335 /DNA_END=562 /DNA_ORIENTATION=+
MSFSLSSSMVSSWVSLHRSNSLRRSLTSFSEMLVEQLLLALLVFDDVAEVVDAAVALVLLLSQDLLVAALPARDEV